MTYRHRGTGFSQSHNPMRYRHPRPDRGYEFTKMNIAVYSGSFNPLHIGHLAIMKHAVEEAGFDMVYLIVSPKNPLKDGISSATGPERLQAAVEAVNRRFPHPTPEMYDQKDRDEFQSIQPKIKVDDIELTMPEPHYTIRTLDALKEREPKNSFTFIMGADNLADIRRWRDYSRILKEFGTAVFPRTGFDLDKIIQDLLKEDPEYKIHIFDAPMVDISSTQIREALASGQNISDVLM